MVLPTMKKLFTVSLKAVIKKNNKILLLIKTKDGKHEWDMPGGRIEASETFDEVLQREMSEELPGCSNVKVIKQIYTWRSPANDVNNNGYIKIYFEVEANLDNFTLSDEHTGYKWVDLGELNELIQDKSIVMSKGFELAARYALS
jgi:8-oxo-dGTP diphosphatase